MMLVDGHAYSAAGVAGAFATDALIGIVTCLVAGTLLGKFDSGAFRSRVQTLNSAALCSRTSDESGDTQGLADGLGATLAAVPTREK